MRKGLHSRSEQQVRGGEGKSRKRWPKLGVGGEGESPRPEGWYEDVDGATLKVFEGGVALGVKAESSAICAS